MPVEEPGLEELTGRRLKQRLLLQSTKFTAGEVRELWAASRSRLAISSTQDWATAAIHRAVAHISALIPEEETELRQQLDGVRHLACFLGKSVEDGFVADAAVAASVTTATRRSVLQLLPNLSTAQKTALAEAPISGDNFFGNKLQDSALSESSEKRRNEQRIVSALSRNSSGRGKSAFNFPTGRAASNRWTPPNISRGPSRARPAGRFRGRSRPFQQRAPTLPSTSRGRGRGSGFSTSRGRSQRRV